MPGLDYEESTGTLTIAAGTLEGVIEVPVHGDALAEEDETIVLEITSITGATAPDRVTLTIRDTEPDVAVIAGRAIDGAEGFEPVSLAIRWWQNTLPAEVSWTTASIQKIAANQFGFAVTNDDFNPATGTFHLTTASSADSALVHVPDDGISENAETFSVLWQLPPRAVAGSWGQRLVHATSDPPLSSTDGRRAAFYDEDTGDIALFRREQSALGGWAEFRRLQPGAASWQGEWLRLRKGHLMFWDKRLQEVLLFWENHGGPDNWGLHSRIPVTGNSLSFDGDVFVQGPNPVSVRERNWKGEWQVMQTLDMAGFDLSKPLTLSVDGTVIAVCGVVGQAPGDRVVLRIFERTPGGEARWTGVRDWILTDASGGVAGAVGVDRGVIVAGFSQAPVNKMTIFRRGSGGQWQLEQTIDATGPLTLDRGAFVASKELWARTGMGGAPWQKVSFLHSRWANVDICNGVMTGADRIPVTTTGVSFTDAGFIAEAGVRCGIADDDSHIVSVYELVNTRENPNTIAEARMRLSVSWPIHIPTHIPWHTVDDTAVAGIDYIGASGVATIFPGRTSTDISLGILPDADTTLNERFQVVLEKPNFGRSTEAAQYVNISNWTMDWYIPDRSFTFPEPESGEQTFVIPVSLPYALTTPMSFDYTVSAGTATTGDFIAGTFSLTLPAGASVIPVSIVIRADGVAEPVETFSIIFWSSRLTSFTVRIDDSTAPGLNRHNFSTSQGTTLVQNAPGVLAGNTGGYLLSRIVQPAAHGTVMLQSDGAFTYTPAPNFAGVDQFSFQAISSADVLIAAPDTETWRWHHPLNGTDPADSIPGFHGSWMNSGFDDTGWNTGTGLMAYGAIGPGAGEPIDTNIGIPPSGQRYSAYFRRTFSATELPGPLTVEFVCDDAAIFYVNGIEAARFADPPIGDFGSAPDSYKLLSSSSVGDSSEPLVQTLVLPAGTREGGNLLAISLHNRSETSSDLGFRLHSLYPGIWSQPVWVTIVVNESGQPPRLSPDIYNFPAFSPAVDSMLGKTTSLFDNDGLLNDSGVMIDPILEVATGGSPAGPVQVDPANGHFRMEVPPGFFGQTGFTYRVRDKDGWSDFVPVTINVAPSSPLDTWRLQHFGPSSINADGSPLADPDADGFANVFEFLHGSMPGQPDDASMPTASLADGEVVLEFVVPAGSWSGITLIVECAERPDTNGWRPLAVFTDFNESHNLPPGMSWGWTLVGAHRIYQINTGTPLEEKRFYRLRANVLAPWWTQQ